MSNKFADDTEMLVWGITLKELHNFQSLLDHLRELEITNSVQPIVIMCLLYDWHCAGVQQMQKTVTDLEELQFSVKNSVST